VKITYVFPHVYSNPNDFAVAYNAVNDDKYPDYGLIDEKRFYTSFSTFEKAQAFKASLRVGGDAPEAPHPV
jgi:hypothetical protein